MNAYEIFDTDGKLLESITAESLADAIAYAMRVWGPNCRVSGVRDER